MTTVHFVIIISAGFLCNALLTPVIIKVAHRRKWYDEKNHRKIHVMDTPRLGGVGMFASFFVGTLVVIALAARSIAVASDALDWTAAFLTLLRRYAPFLVGMVIIHALGLVDDFRNLRAINKLLIQFLAAVVVVIGPFRIERLLVPFAWTYFDLGIAGYPITVIWIVAVSNALNFIDGVDGLAGGTAAIASLFFALVGFLLGQTVAAAIALSLFGALLGFLVYNLPQARVFMGDSGSYLLGFVLGVLPLMTSSGLPRGTDLIPAITIIAIPVSDMTISVVRRLKRGQHPFTADREHMHHKLMDVGLGTWSILAVVYTLNLVLGAVAVTWYFMGYGLSLALIAVTWLALITAAFFLRRASKRVDDKP